MTTNPKALPLHELRQRWTEVWGITPHKGIGRTMLEKSLEFKTRNGLTPDHEALLNQLIKEYKRNPKCFGDGYNALKPGTRLIRNWKGTRHAVTVKANGFDYQGRHYTSLSQIANDITGSRWNGHLFFGLKKQEKA